MTTKKVFVPVLIENAEQTEALPVGTLAYRDRAGKGRRVAVKLMDPWGDLPSMWAVEGLYSRSHEVVGWTALVPVEAEEEFFMTHDGRPFGLPMDEAAARTDAARNAHRGAGVAHRFVTLEEPA